MQISCNYKFRPGICSQLDTHSIPISLSWINCIVHDNGHYVRHKDKEVHDVEEASQIGPFVKHESQYNHL